LNIEIASNQLLPGLVQRIRSAEPERLKNCRIVAGIRTGPELCPNAEDCRE